MKKFKILMLLLVFMLLLPNNVLAAGIKDSRISDDQNVKTGDTITLSLYMTFSDVDRKNVDSFGVGGVLMEFEYDEDIFKFIEAKASGFDTKYLAVDGEKGIISVINGENLLENSCIDGILYCGEYGLTLKFYVKDTNAQNATIKVTDAAVMGWQLQNGTHPTYDEDDVLAFESSINKTWNFVITKTETIPDAPKVVTETTTNASSEAAISNVVTKKVDDKEKETTATTSGSKSKNSYLKDIKVKGYILNFYKRTQEYNITVEENVDSLDIEAKLDDEKSTLEIIGAKKLSANNNKVLIEVTAEDGSKRTYTINVSYREKEKKNKLGTKAILTQIKELFNKYKLYITIGGISLLIMIIVLIIVNKVNDNKLKKKFDQF